MRWEECEDDERDVAGLELFGDTQTPGRAAPRFPHWDRSWNMLSGSAARH